jgi:hypothetical protein
VFGTEHTLRLWKRHSCTSTVWRQLTDWPEQVRTWSDLRRLLYSGSDIMCLLIEFNCNHKYVFNMGFVNFRPSCAVRRVGGNGWQTLLRTWRTAYRFRELFFEDPHLWPIKSALLHDKIKENQAWDTLVSEVKAVDLSATKARDVKNIYSLWEVTERNWRQNEGTGARTDNL